MLKYPRFANLALSGMALHVLAQNCNKDRAYRCVNIDFFVGVVSFESINVESGILYKFF